MKLTIAIIGVAVLVALIVLAWMQFSPEPVRNPQAGSIEVVSAMSGGDTAGYTRAIEPREFVFPQDHGAHPNFKTEWWYFTGNLTDKNGRQFGFQLTFFRSAVSSDSIYSTSNWAANQVYMGHFALSDIARDRFYSFEQFSRGAAGLAGAQAQPFRVWLYDWQAHSTKNTFFPLRIEARDSTVAISLVLDSLKPLVLQGERGLSRKGRGEGNASYYYSYTRLAAKGEITVDGERYAVDGSAWLDREWSTSALEPNQEGWDWFALQLSNGADLMYYQMRTRDGGVDPASTGVLVAADGRSTTLGAGDVDISVAQHWKSPWSGADYPARWRLRIAKQNIDIQAEPLISDQELQVSVQYWEGATGVRGTWQGAQVDGRGYIEMTGYGKKPGAKRK